MKFALLLSIAVFVFAPGCISKHSGGMVDARKAWVVGTTVKRDVVEKWGNPDSVFGDVWVWKESRLRGGRVTASYYRIGLTIERKNIMTLEHHLRFCNEGKLVSHDVLEACEDGAEWDIIPWRN